MYSCKYQLSPKTRNPESTSSPAREGNGGTNHSPAAHDLSPQILSAALHASRPRTLDISCDGHSALLVQRQSFFRLLYDQVALLHLAPSHSLTPLGPAPQHPSSLAETAASPHSLSEVELHRVQLELSLQGVNTKGFRRIWRLKSFWLILFPLARCLLICGAKELTPQKKKSQA